MIGVAAVLVLTLLSVVITRIGAVALRATGVSEDLALFQARSTFTGVGYTTEEAESVAGHPVRRRIVLALMLLGNAGIASVVASLVLGFSGATRGQSLLRLGVLLAGLLVLWAATRTAAFDRLATRVIETALDRWTDLQVRDYAQLLDVSGPYTVRDIPVEAGDWLADTALEELSLPREGVLVLGIRRDNGTFIGAPLPDTEIAPGDTVVLYGREDHLDELGQRTAGAEGDAAHRSAARTQQHMQEAEQARDRRADAEQRAVRLARQYRADEAARAERAAASAERRAAEARRRADRSRGGGDD